MKNLLLILSMIILGSLISCVPETGEETDSSTTFPQQNSNWGNNSNWGDWDGNNSGGNNGNNNGGNNGGSTGTPTCTGTTSDGDGTGQVPIFIRDISMAGYKTGSAYPDQIANGWVPRIQPYESALSFIPTIESVENQFTSNSRHRVRFKIMPQPSTCPLQFSGTKAAYSYNKLKFTINFRPAQVDINNQLMLPIAYQAPYVSLDVGPVDVNSCSQIYDIPRYPIPGPVVVEITNVKSDYGCQMQGNGGWLCPAEELVRAQDCWRVIMQIVNDETGDFQ